MPNQHAKAPTQGNGQKHSLDRDACRDAEQSHRRVCLTFIYDPIGEGRRRDVAFPTSPRIMLTLTFRGPHVSRPGLLTAPTAPKSSRALSPTGRLRTLRARAISPLLCTEQFATRIPSPAAGWIVTALKSSPVRFSEPDALPRKVCCFQSHLTRVPECVRCLAENNTIHFIPLSKKEVSLGRDVSSRSPKHRCSPNRSYARRNEGIFLLETLVSRMPDAQHV